MIDVNIRRVQNGFILTVGQGDNEPAPQYVARDFEQLCELLKTVFTEPEEAA